MTETLSTIIRSFARVAKPMTLRLAGRHASSLVLAGCVLLAACGDDQPSDTQQIASAVKRATVGENVKDQCEAAVSSRYVREFYGSVAVCREQNEPDPDDKTRENATVSDTRIDGDKATTGVVATVDGEQVGKGRFALVKESGDWKVDRLGVDFLRSVIAYIAKQPQSPPNRAVTECFARAARTLPGDDVRHIGYALISSRITEDEVASRLRRKCLTAITDATLVRQIFEADIIASAQIELDKKQQRCVKLALRRAISTAQIRTLFRRGAPTPAVRDAIQRAIDPCVPGRRGAQRLSGVDAWHEPLRVG